MARLPLANQMQSIAMCLQTTVLRMGNTFPHINALIVSVNNQNTSNFSPKSRLCFKGITL